MAMNSVSSNTAAAIAANPVQRPQARAAQEARETQTKTAGTPGATPLNGVANEQAAKSVDAARLARAAETAKPAQTAPVAQVAKPAEETASVRKLETSEVRQAEAPPPKPVVNERGQKTGTIINTTA